MPTNNERTLKESRANWNQFELNNLLAPLAVGSANVRNQYLSVSRYVAGNPAIPRRRNNSIFLSENPLVNP